MTRTFNASIWQEGNWYVAQCMEVDVASQGKTKEQAVGNLSEALELHFEGPQATILPDIRQFEVELHTTWRKSLRFWRQNDFTVIGTNPSSGK